MILDSSAIVAILLREPDHETLLDCLGQTDTAAVGAPTLTESGIVLTARLGVQGKTLLARFVQEAALTVIPFAPEHHSAALDAYLRYGKGRHAAALNFGDCMTYATARLAGRPLLCIGEDFAQTDIALVV
ncbi:MAG TPA: type II toxin-antitoxin system VapC family toxin [Solirubrobacteraceae bacterium]|nr:type II toxin-antitoxin system VapC family toxin [Solirubrobacteraceae bacterium]